MLSHAVWIAFLAAAHAAVLPPAHLQRQAKSPSISSIVVFGDSFSDNGKRPVVVRWACVEDGDG